jgi:hypothetical protein
MNSLMELLMKRIVLVYLLFLVAGFSVPAESVSAQEWADKMFKVRSHDFGTVARGAKSDFVFEFENIYEETIHVAAVRANCGCTTPIIETDSVKTWEIGRIRARFNTDSFVGDRKATITVVIDEPFRAEVQLNIKGSIRTDIQFEPGVVDVGNTDRGTKTIRTVRASHFNDPNWKITDVLCTNQNYAVYLQEVERNSARVTYELKIETTESLPEGVIRDELIIVTNHPQHQRLNLAVQGQVIAPLSISPAHVDFGDVAVGQAITKKIFIRSSEPLEIQSVMSATKSMTFQTRQINANVSEVSVTLTGTADDEIAKSPIEVDANIGRRVKVAIPVSAIIK